MLMFDDKREIESYNNEIAEETIRVGDCGITKIEVYKEMGERDWIAYLKVWKGEFLFMRTQAIGKEIIYKGR